MTFAEWIRNFIDTIFHSRYVCHLEAEVLVLRNERDVLEGKLSRMECILMPLQSVGGAAYARSLQPVRKPELPTPLAAAPRQRTWSEIQAEWERAQEAAEDADLMKEET